MCIRAHIRKRRLTDLGSRSPPQRRMWQRKGGWGRWETSTGCTPNTSGCMAERRHGAALGQDGRRGEPLTREDIEAWGYKKPSISERKGKGEKPKMKLPPEEETNHVSQAQKTGEERWGKKGMRNLKSES